MAQQALQNVKDNFWDDTLFKAKDRKKKKKEKNK